MENIIQFLKSDTFLWIMIGLILVLGISFLILYFKISKLNKRYQKFMQKLGQGTNLEEDLQRYMNQVEEVEEQNEQILTQIKKMDNKVSNCIQKVGIVRYSAFKDTGSDLSFALALLDNEKNGVVLNGIYSREMSNIYAKPVEHGTSTYTISEEEAMAIKKASEER